MNDNANDSAYEAVILDMDGVITHTAVLHARAWKQMFDEYLAQRARREGKTFEPFDLQMDYQQYVDGKPRMDGVRSFLLSRDIELLEGSDDDPPDRETICGLGNRKNHNFQELLASEKVEVYSDTLQQLDTWQQKGLKLAVVSSSRNCAQILEAARMLHRFDAKVDGEDLDRLQLAGKPAPDMFLEAARQLAVPPGRAIVIEDALAGVQAARRGQFGLVVGVARDGDKEALQQAGADVVVSDLRDLQTSLTD